ncbi:glycine cleavage system protein GcvH [Elusimicrobiota bacterium]
MEIRYAKTHEWARKDSEKVFTVGISDFAQKEIRDIVYIELPKVGTQLTKGSPCGMIESVKAAFDMYAPLSGTVTKVNDSAAQDVTAIHQDPLGKGWLYEMEPGNPSEFETLMSEADYNKTAAQSAH